MHRIREVSIDELVASLSDRHRPVHILVKHSIILACRESNHRRRIFQPQGGPVGDPKQSRFGNPDIILKHAFSIFQRKSVLCQLDDLAGNGNITVGERHSPPVDSGRPITIITRILEGIDHSEAGGKSRIPTKLDVVMGIKHLSQSVPLSV